MPRLQGGGHQTILPQLRSVFVQRLYAVERQQAGAPKESDISDWKVTFVDTGLSLNIGQRLKAVEKYLTNEEYFLANYADALTDLHLPDEIERLEAERQKIACFVCVKPSEVFRCFNEGRGLCRKNQFRKKHRYQD